MASQTSNNNTFNTEAFSNMFKDLKMPKVDFESTLSAHKKNLETLTKAQKSCFDCAKTVSEAHTNYLKQSFDDIKSHWQDLMSSKSLEDKVQAHTTRVKNFFENSLNHGRSLGEQILKSQQDISSTVQDRLAEGSQEVQEVAKKAAPFKQ